MGFLSQATLIGSPSSTSGKWLTKDKTFGPDGGPGILKSLQNNILEGLAIWVAFEQVPLQRFLHFPGKQAEVLWELLREYLEKASLPMCWYSPYHKASCCCHCAVKAGEEGILHCCWDRFWWIILLTNYSSGDLVGGWRHDAGVNVV